MTDLTPAPPPGKLVRLWRWFTLADVSPETDPIRTMSAFVVAVATAILSYSTLRELSLAIGSTDFASYLFPLAFDAAVLTFTRTWLNKSLSKATRQTGKWFAILTILASIVGNSLWHWRTGVKAGDPSWWLWTVIVFSALIPLILGFVTHVLAMVGEDIRQRKADDAAALAKLAAKHAARPRAEDKPVELVATGTDGPIATVTPIGVTGSPRERIAQVRQTLLAAGHTIAHGRRGLPLGDGEDYSFAQIDRLANTNGYAKTIVPALEDEEKSRGVIQDGD